MRHQVNAAPPQCVVCAGCVLDPRIDHSNHSRRVLVDSFVCICDPGRADRGVFVAAVRNSHPAVPALQQAASKHIR